MRPREARTPAARLLPAAGGSVVWLVEDGRVVRPVSNLRFTQSFLEALARPTVGHLDPQFLALMDEVNEGLRRAFGTKNPMTFPVSGTGSVAPVEKEPCSVTSEAERGPCRILLAEDDTNIRLGLIATLESDGYGVTAASDGAQALKLFPQERFDLVILDNVLEHVNDREKTLREIRRVLAPDGLLYLVTPKPFALAIRLFACLPLGDVATRANLACAALAASWACWGSCWRSSSAGSQRKTTRPTTAEPRKLELPTSGSNPS